MTDTAATTTTRASSTNPVFRDAIHAETVRKEMKRFRIYEEYMLTPAVKKGLVVAEKPNRINIQALDGGAGDGGDAGVTLPSTNLPFHPTAAAPARTTNALYGQHTQPLVRTTDRRFFHPKVETEITKMYGAVVVKKDDPAAAAGKKPAAGKGG
ncbi:hypothetical protein DFJ77DRAFT_548751 [Powellomyces hirtus]|nr:hypothetical protein DFJ77DRAFT_548751 [Powellomyces hirtus]